MRRLAILVGIVALMASCSYQTCPTYSKADKPEAASGQSTKTQFQHEHSVTSKVFGR